MSVNYINEGLQTFGMVDNLYRGDREEERLAAERKRQVTREDERDAAWREDRHREKDTRNTKAELHRLEQELAQEIGPYAAEYLHPEKRGADRKYLGEAMGRLQAGKLDHDFFLDYANNVYASQINRGTGGVKKRIIKIGASQDGKGIVAGLDVADEKGSVRQEMMTKNRGTREEGDNEVKVIPIAQLVRDNIQRQIIIDSFDRNGVGEGSPEEQKQKIQAAIAEAKARLLELGDTSIAQRDQALAAEGRQSQAALDLARYTNDLAMERDKTKHGYDVDLAGINNAAALDAAKIKASGTNIANNPAVKESLDNYYKMRQNWISAKAGGVIETTDPYTGMPTTRKATYEDITYLERAMEEELEFLRSAGAFSRPALPVGPQGGREQPGPWRDGYAMPGEQQAQPAAGLPEGAVLGKPRPVKGGGMAYPVIDGKTGRQMTNQQTGKPLYFTP